MKSFKSFMILATLLAISAPAFADPAPAYYYKNGVFGRPHGYKYYIKPDIETKGSGYVHADYHGYGDASVYMKNKAYADDGYYPSGYGQNWQDVYVKGDNIYASMDHMTKAKADSDYYPLKYEATDSGWSHLGTGNDYGYGKLWGDSKSSFNPYGAHSENKVYGKIWGKDGYVGAHNAAKAKVVRTYDTE